jgi:hydroxymethylbilane synthase
LALETRSPNHPRDADDPTRDPEIFKAIRALEHAQTRFATDAERAFLARMGGGCELPLGAHCLASEGVFRLYAQVLSPDGEQMVQTTLDRDPEEPAEALGQRAADLLTEQGALQLLAAPEV